MATVLIISASDLKVLRFHLDSTYIIERQVFNMTIICDSLKLLHECEIATSYRAGLETQLIRSMILTPSGGAVVGNGDYD